MFVALGGCGGGGEATPDAGTDTGVAVDATLDTSSSTDTTPPPPYVFSDDAKRVFAQAALARSGKPADFDGDGVAEFVPTTNDDGSVTVTVDRTGSGTPEFTYTWNAKTGQGSVTIDANTDGTLEMQRTITSSPYTQVTSVDDDLDGTFERRVTQTWDDAAQTIHVVVETLDATSGAFTVTSDTTISSHLEGDGTCAAGNDGTAGANFPAASPTQNVPGTNINVHVSNTGSDGSKGECSFDHTNELLAAIDCAATHGLQCLRGTNDAAADLLETALTYGKLDISCGNQCVSATTLGENNCGPGSDDSCNDVRTSFSPKVLGASGSGGDCIRALHEMLHWAGLGLDDDHHDEGVDTIYACARYCGGCMEAPPFAPAGKDITKNTDCAKCSDTSDRRGQCGLVPTTKPSTVNYAVCHSGLGCIAANCEQPVESSEKDCSGRTVTLGAWCCQKCPASCDTSNDQPCEAPPPDAGTTTCTGATPYCG